MPRYMFLAQYAKTGETAKARRTRIEKAAADLLGTIETLDCAFGEQEFYTICELPNNAAAAGFSNCVRFDPKTAVRTIALPAPRRRIGYLAPSVPA